MKTIILLLANLTLFLGLNAQELAISTTKNSNNHVLKFDVKDNKNIDWIVVEKFDATAKLYRIVKDVQMDELNKKNACEFYLVDNKPTKDAFNSAFVVKVYTKANKYIQYNSVEENNQIVFKAAAKTESSIGCASYTKAEYPSSFSVEFAWNREEIEQMFAKTSVNNSITASNNTEVKSPAKYAFAPKVDFETAIAAININAAEAKTPSAQEMNITGDDFDALAKSIEMREDEICNQEYAEMAAIQKMNEPEELSDNGSGLRVLPKEDPTFLSYAAESKEIKETEETEDLNNETIVESMEMDPATK